MQIITQTNNGVTSRDVHHTDKFIDNRTVDQTGTLDQHCSTHSTTLSHDHREDQTVIHDHNENRPTVTQDQCQDFMVTHNLQSRIYGSAESVKL